MQEMETAFLRIQL